MAATIRASARPDPLSVCTSSGLAPGSGRYRMAMRRDWKSLKFEHELTSSQRSTPGAHTSRSYLRAWVKPISRVLMSSTR